MLHGIHVDIVYSNTGYDVTSYFGSAVIEVRETAENAASYGFGTNFSGAAFYLPHPLVGFLFRYATAHFVMDERLMNDERRLQSTKVVAIVLVFRPKHYRQQISRRRLNCWVYEANRLSFAFFNWKKFVVTFKIQFSR